ncbi:hypothetical protein KB206_02170 [Microvirga sp. STS02]|uniref:hypothetical protein n=1 Tax=Hymenobacter negativus TaxID=2795026 RepID=UPI0018DAF5FC|nr:MULTISPECIES: hypothetical protein [Bacteria]MBH8567672.1 hypothetical protein [Hymenobacter negativus]MBR7207406.1 hypothetical protein [Microvirga sp. STS02]
MNTPAKTCVICYSPLYSRADKTTCSDACRVRLHRQRQNEDIHEPDEEGNGQSTGHDALLDLPWLRQQPITSTERDYLNRRDEPEDHEGASEQKRSSEAALAKQLQADYVKIVESFLEKEHKRLRSRQLRQMLRTSMYTYESYKLHPQLTQAGSNAQKCQKDLREIIIIIQETHQDAQNGWLSHTSQYELTKKWRRQLQERLLG